MDRNMSVVSGGRGAVWTFLSLLLLLAAPAMAATKGGASPPLRIVSPPDRALVSEKNLFLAGSVTDPQLKSVTITGVATKPKKTVPVAGGAFGAMLFLREGKNTVTVTAGKLKKTITIHYLPAKKLGKAPSGLKRFYVHRNQQPLTCKECHRFRRGKFNFKRIIPARANCTTGKCHSNMGKAEHVHGPVGAGVCISCHNPHGSTEPKELARTGGELCLVCHQAKRHELQKRVVHPPVEEGCIDCHDPHQSPMRFQLRAKGGPVSNLCFNCHEKEMFTKKHQHGPVAVGDCTACHQPHASDNDKLLIAPQEKGQLCFQCHQDRRDEFSMKFVHDPVAEDCGNCHDPHSAKAKFQLVEAVPKLCASCHEEISPEVYQDIKTATYKHKPVDQGKCTACHRPHTANYRPMLRNSMPKLCFGCHVELGDEVMESKYKHGPVKSGDCTDCHKPHGSTFSRMLVREFPKDFYTPYKEKKYDLCFGCHNKEIAKKKRTTTLTNFRDGDYNLHYFHVHREKGRSCIACHDPHASNQAKHIRYEVPFGSWSYPISFTKTKTGGTCVVGCHAPKQYDRKNPKLKKHSG